MMRIAIVDDLATERELLKKRLENGFHRRSVQVSLFEYANGEDFLAAAKEQNFTAAFLDIYMDGISGMDAAKELRKFDTNCLLIFTTTSTDHALEGFQVRAMHYLVKPSTEEDLDQLIEEILSRIPKPERYIDVKVSGSDIRLRYKDIVYAEHFSHMIHIHTIAKNTLITRQSFKEFIASLKEDPRFFICNRGIVVNLEHAIDFEDTFFVMEEESRVFVSRELLKNARRIFMEFLLQRGH